MGLLARNGATFSSVALKQFIVVAIGSVLAFLTSKIPYTFWKKWAFHIFVGSIVLTLLVFHSTCSTPNLAEKIDSIGPITIQPGEFLKFAFVIYPTVWLAGVKEKISTFKFHLPTVTLLAITGVILLNQPDTDTFISIFLAGVGMFVVAGGRFRHLFALGGISMIGFSGLVLARPYPK